MKHAVVPEVSQKDFDTLLGVKSKTSQLDERQNPGLVEQFARLVQKPGSLRVGQPPLGFAAGMKTLHPGEWLSSQNIHASNAGFEQDPR